jgi:hypothetical protein
MPMGWSTEWYIINGIGKPWALSEDEIEHYLGKAYTKALIACVTFPPPAI